MSREFRSIVRKDMVWRASLNKQVAEPFQNIFAGQPPRHIDRQTLPGELIDQCQQPNRSTIISPAEYEVAAPHMVPVLRTKANARTVIQPQPATLRLLPRHL